MFMGGSSPVESAIVRVAPRAYHHEILDDFPHLEREDVAEALQYAAEAVRERQLPLVEDG